VTGRELTPLPDLAHDGPFAGPVRRRLPVYVDLLPPCNAACPAGENIQAWLAEARAGRYEQAWAALVADNPFPAVEGRVCYRRCEGGCNRAELDSAVSIHAVERFLGDRALEQKWRVSRPETTTGRRVLVVGGGPCGLSAAYHLARRGHAVEIRDAGEQPGGMMRYGIPAYRLPRDVLDGELARWGDLGVTMTFGHRVTDLETERRAGGFDAVLVAVGAQLARRVDIPTADATRIVDAVALLHDVAAGERPRLGRRVAVYGGGDTAVDAARTAVRLGAEETLLVYRRTRDRMPAHVEETAAAEREGVRMHWLRTVSALDGGALTVEEMELGTDGVPRPTGRTEVLGADSLVLALGQQADTGFLRSVAGVEVSADGSVVVDDALMTGAPGIFAGGDAVPAERTVTVSVGHGKRAARSIDAWLRGLPAAARAQHRTATFDLLHPWYFGDTARRQETELSPAVRVRGFAEVVGGLTEQQAVYEAGRCLSCGNCFECDGCFGACPEHAVVKLGPGARYRIDEARCTGCGVCADQCPVHAIEMVPEPRAGGVDV